MLAHEHGLGSETLSPFVDSSVDNVLLLTNPDFTSHFLNSSIFLNVMPIYYPPYGRVTLLVKSTYTRVWEGLYAVAVRGTRS